MESAIFENSIQRWLWRVAKASVLRSASLRRPSVLTSLRQILTTAGVIRIQVYCYSQTEIYRNDQIQFPCILANCEATFLPQNTYKHHIVARRNGLKIEPINFTY